MPIIDFKFELLSASVNINNSEAISGFYLNVLLVAVLRQNESNVTLKQKVDASEEVTFDRDEFVNFVESWLEQWAYPSYELQRFLLKDVKL